MRTYSIVKKQILVSTHGTSMVDIKAADFVKAKHARRWRELRLNDQISSVPFVNGQALVCVFVHCNKCEFS